LTPGINSKHNDHQSTNQPTSGGCNGSPSFWRLSTMYHCHHCDSYFNTDRLNQLPSGLSVHRCGHVPNKLNLSEALPFVALVDRHDRRTLDRLFKNS
jgi:hypothetical protein